MTDLGLLDPGADPAVLDADALVVGAYAGDDGPEAAEPRFADVVAAGALAGCTGKPGNVITIPGEGLVAAERVVIAGLGARPGVQVDATRAAAEVPASERVRRAAGAASRACAGRQGVVSTLSALDLRAAAEGHLLGAYAFTAYKEPDDPPVASVQLARPEPDASNAPDELARAVVVARAVARVRDWVNTAPNELYPAVFAEQAEAFASAAGLEVEILDDDQLRKGGYGGITAVGAGSTRPPRLVRIRSAPPSPVASVALVGKGITFDSGGISIKPALNMDHMTCDMGGAAAVLATAIAAAELGLPVTVTAYAALAENLPSGSAYRPGDVIRHYGGTTSHVLNTDAEGRLVLADAITRACEDEPDYLLETSTLTGAQVVALGARTMGVMGSPELRDRVAGLARETGEGGWAMPLPPELREGLDSPLADLANVSGNRAGGMLVAGHYLAAFVADGVPWAHLDVAGPAFHADKPYGYVTTGGTGVPVRTLLATLEDLAEHAGPAST